MQQKVGQLLENRLAVEGHELLPADLTGGRRGEETLVSSEHFIRMKRKPAEQIAGGQR